MKSKLITIAKGFLTFRESAYLGHISGARPGVKPEERLQVITVFLTGTEPALLQFDSFEEREAAHKEILTAING